MTDKFACIFGQVYIYKGNVGISTQEMLVRPFIEAFELLSTSFDETPVLEGKIEVIQLATIGIIIRDYEIQ